MEYPIILRFGDEYRTTKYKIMLRDKEFDPNISYSRTYEDTKEKRVASWVEQGLPVLFPQFLKLIKDSKAKGIHLDVGTYDGQKAIQMAKSGLTPLVGIDVDFLGNLIPSAKQLAQQEGLDGLVAFEKVDARGMLPFQDNSVASVTNICCAGTHFTDSERLNHASELSRVMSEGAYMLSVDFSGSDNNFYGFEISGGKTEPSYKEYTYVPNPKHPFSNEKYLGMFNQHHVSDQMQNLYGPNFELVGAVHIQHPNAKKDVRHAGRYLWVTIYKNRKVAK